MNKQAEQFVRDFLDRQYLKYSKEDDLWRGEIYCDYSDELADSQITKIVQSKSPRDEMFSVLDDAYSDSDWYYRKELKSELRRAWDAAVRWSDVEDDVDEFIDEHVYYDVPYEHYEKQTVYVDIILDTGDGNYDYTLNCVYPHYDGVCGQTIDDHSAIANLTKWQGYSKTAMKNSLNNGVDGGSKFLKSLRVEIENCSTHMNAIVFLAEMTLGECIELNERILAAQKSDEKSDKYYPWKYKSRDSIWIPAKTTCGLYDPWSGAGGPLEIEIEKGFNLPVKFIDSAWPDGGRGYSVGEIYGVTRQLWDGIELRARKVA